MKRVFLNPELRRAAVCALASYACNGHAGRKTGDPIHDWITEGRRKQYEEALARGDDWAVNLSKKGGYSSCGDLAHWVLFCLGLRDERILNRTTDGGQVPWVSGVNISRILLLDAYERHPKAFKAGDILHIAYPDHVCVVDMFDFDHGTISSWNYGAPHGKYAESQLLQRGSTTLIGTRTIVGRVDIDRVKLAESSIVPDSFDVGDSRLDDNPYPEAFVIPDEVA